MKCSKKSFEDRGDDDKDMFNLEHTAKSLKAAHYIGATGCQGPTWPKDFPP